MILAGLITKPRLILAGVTVAVVFAAFQYGVQYGLARQLRANLEATEAARRENATLTDEAIRKERETAKRLQIMRGRDDADSIDWADSRLPAGERERMCRALGKLPTDTGCAPD